MKSSFYSIHAADRSRLESLKLSPEESEADNLHRVLNRYLAGQPPERPRRRTVDADARVAKAVQAIIAHNDAQNRSEADKWALTPKAVARLSGCFMPVIKRHFEHDRSVITDHNRRHSLTPGQNVRHGKLGRSISACIKL